MFNNSAGSMSALYEKRCELILVLSSLHILMLDDQASFSFLFSHKPPSVSGLSPTHIVSMGQPLPT